MDKKTLRKFEKLVQAHGLKLEQGRRGGHYAVTKNGARVGTLSTSGETNALRQAVRDLCRQNLLPQEARRVTF